MDGRISRLELPEVFQSLYIGNIEYKIVREVGRGASSIAYEAKTSDGLYIVKEFHPKDISKWGLDRTIIPCEGCEAAFQERKQKFEEAKQYHTGMSQQDRNFFLESEELPDSVGFMVMRSRAGDTLYQWRQSQDLSIDDPDSLKAHILTCVKYIRYFTGKLEQVYHGQGYLHLDIKPENVFVFDNEDVLLRLFDFDSMQSMNVLFVNIQNQTAQVYTTLPPDGPYGNEVNDINRLSVKTAEELKAIDYHAVGNLFHFMLYGCYYRSRAEKDPAVDTYIYKYPALKVYLDNIFNLLCSDDFNERLCNYKELDQYLSHIDFWFFQAQEDFLQSFNREHLKTHFKSYMMPALSYDGEEYRGELRLYQLLQKTPGNLQIIGQGGSGKSTLLKYFAYLSATLFAPWKYICYYEELRNLTNDRSVEQLVKKIKERPEPGAKTIWLLDAFDEIAKKERADQLLDRLSNIDIPGIRIVISSRSKIGRLAYPVVQMMRLSDRQLKKIFKPAELGGLPFDFGENDFISTPLGVNLLKGMEQYYNGNRFQSFQEYLIGERQSNGTIKISSLGELVWNYLHIITLSSALDSDSKIEDGLELLHEILINSHDIIVNGRRLQNGRYDNKSETFTYTDIDPKLLKKLKQFEKLGYYSVIPISNPANTIRGHTLEFSHEVFIRFFVALHHYYNCKKLYERLTTTSNLVTDALLHETFPFFDSNSVFREDGLHILESTDPYALCKDIFNSLPKNHEIPLSILKALRNHFNDDVFLDSSLYEWDDDICYLAVVAELLYYLCTYESGKIVFRDLDLSYLSLGELPVYNHVPPEEVIFENITFDGSLVWLRSDCWYRFKNCSFKNLNENSFIHPSLNISGADGCYAVGQDLYTINRDALMDCIETDDTEQEIIIYPNTRIIDAEFILHNTMRTRPIHICDENHCFQTDDSNNILFKGQSIILVNNIADSLIFGSEPAPTSYTAMTHHSGCRFVDWAWIGYAALWYCDKLNVVRLADSEPKVPGTARLGKSPFVKCDNLKIIEIDGYSVIEDELFVGCTRIKGIHILGEQRIVKYGLPIYMLSYRDEWKEIQILAEAYNSKGVAVPYSEGLVTRRPALFVPHALVQEYLNCEFWGEYLIYDEKRLSEIDSLPIDRNDDQAMERFADVCKEDGFEDPFYPRNSSQTRLTGRRPRASRL